MSDLEVTSVVHEPARDEPWGKLEQARTIEGKARDKRIKNACSKILPHLYG